MCLAVCVSVCLSVWLSLSLSLSGCLCLCLCLCVDRALLRRPIEFECSRRGVFKAVPGILLPSQSAGQTNSRRRFAHGVRKRSERGESNPCSYSYLDSPVMAYNRLPLQLHAPFLCKHFSASQLDLRAYVPLLRGFCYLDVPRSAVLPWGARHRRGLSCARAAPRNTLLLPLLPSPPHFGPAPVHAAY